MRQDVTMYIETKRLNDLFVKNDRLSITVDSLSNLNEEVFNDIIKDIIDNNSFDKQDVIDSIYGNSRTKIIVKTIIMDQYLAGIYLVDENSKKITVPGGHVSNQDIYQDQTPISMMETNLCRELCEEFGGIESIYKPMVQNNNVSLQDTLNRLGFSFIHDFKPMYLYNPKYSNTLTIYFPVVVEDSSRGFAYNNSVYLSKSEYEFTRDYHSLYDKYYEGIENDIRCNEYSFLLDFIFNTSIF